MNSDTATKALVKKREPLYDWLRIFATIWVVIGHSAYLDTTLEHGSVCYTLPAGLSPAYDGVILRFIRFLSGWTYLFHMPLFFALSGAVLALFAIPRFDDLVRSKARRLLLPYYLCGWLFMLPVKTLAGIYDHSSLPEAMRGFLSGEDAGHLWFLPALFWSMILFTVIYKLLKRARCESIFLLLFICGAISLSYEKLPFDILYLKTGADYLFYFALGFVFEKERKRLSERTEKEAPRRGVLLVILAALLIIEVLFKKFLILNYFFGILCGCTISIILAALCKQAFPKVSESSFWKLMIKNLFAVYLFHDPLEYLFLKITFDTGLLTNGVGCCLYTFMRTVGIFFISLFLGIALSRILSVLTSCFGRGSDIQKKEVQ